MPKVVVAVTWTVLAYAYWSGFFYLNLYVSKYVGMDAALETDSIEKNYPVAIHCWHWLGVLFWSLVMMGILIFTMEYVNENMDDGIGPGEEPLQVMVASSLWNCLILWLTMITLGFLEPAKNWRHYKLAKNGIDEGTDAIIGCWRNPHPHRLEVPRNATYAKLLDPEWRPNWAKKQSATQYGWTWVLAPIEYIGGPGHVEDCAFDPPIWAVCIDKSPTERSCGFDFVPPYAPPPYGLRKYRVSHWTERFVTEKLPYRNAGLTSRIAQTELVFEWDAPFYEDMVKYLRFIEDEDSKRWMECTIAWFVLTGIVFCCTLVAVVGSDDVDSCGDKKPGVADVPSASSPSTVSEPRKPSVELEAVNREGDTVNPGRAAAGGSGAPGPPLPGAPEEAPGAMCAAAAIPPPGPPPSAPPGERAAAAPPEFGSTSTKLVDVVATPPAPCAAAPGPPGPPPGCGAELLPPPPPGPPGPPYAGPPVAAPLREEDAEV